MLSVFTRRRSFLPRAVEWGVGLVSALLYRVRSEGVAHVPTAGGALLIANHLSYVDVIVLQLACPRRLRFLGYEGFRDQALFRWIFDHAGVIAINPQKPTEGMRRALRALKDGEIVCLFPEGNISRTGQLMEIKPGLEMMARRANVPVIPAAIDGLWGSVFSFAGNKYLWKSPRLMPTTVVVAFGKPAAPEEATVEWARKALLDLGANAFDMRPVLTRHLGREVARALAKNPGRVALVDRTAERRVLTSAQLLAAAAALSRRIRSTIPEARVGIVLPPGAGSFIANLAVTFAGKVPVNMNFTAGRASLEASFALAGVKAVLTAEPVIAKFPQFPWPERSLDIRSEIAAAGGKRAMLPWLLAAWVLPNQWVPGLLGLPKVGDRAEAALLFTSGSSGEPKGVALTHRNLLANCAQISSLAILPRSATMLACLPGFHCFGFTVNIWYPLLRGCRVVTVPSPLDTRRIVDSIREEEVSVFVGAPTFIRPFLKKAEPGELRSLNLCVAGAEKLPDDLYRAFMERFHLEILQGYGLTETTPVANVNQPHPPLVTDTNEAQLGKKYGSVGRLMPGMTARIVDPETGAELPLESTGMLLLKGPNVFSGYLDDQKKTDLAIRDGWLVTGDLAHFDSDGFLTIAGRLSRFSKIGGEMVPHGTVEQTIVDSYDWPLAETPQITVVGVPDKAKGEQLVLLSVVDVALEDLRSRLVAAGLPNLWIPKRVGRVDAIPLLGTGKVDLRRCKELALGVAGTN